MEKFEYFCSNFAHIDFISHKVTKSFVLVKKMTEHFSILMDRIEEGRQLAYYIEIIVNRGVFRSDSREPYDKEQLDECTMFGLRVRRQKGARIHIVGIWNMLLSCGGKNRYWSRGQNDFAKGWLTG